jgi:signal transduction histidine kinase/ActR/RegA family two-component response regulator
MEQSGSKSTRTQTPTERSGEFTLQRDTVLGDVDFDGDALSEQVLRATFERGPEARLLVDDEGRCLSANKNARTIFSQICTDVEEATDIKTLFDFDARLAFSTLWSGRHVQPEQEGTLRARGEGSVLKTYEVQLSSRISDGVHLVTLRDVTEREELRLRLGVNERVSSLGTLASGMAHEINNPLQVIYTSLDVMVRGVGRLAPLGHSPVPVVNEIARELETVRTAAERVQRVVSDMSVFTRAGSDELVPVRVSEALDTAIRATTNIICHRATLVKDIRRTPAVLANEARLTQVFAQLLINASQAIPEGAAGQNEVRVSLFESQKRIEVEISDTGHGMSQEVLRRAFDPFFTTRPVGKGMGLGLSVCHATIAALGGTISADSEPGRGSTFRVSLPVAGASPRVSSITPVPTMLHIPRGLVLVVDDDPMVCKSLSRLLQSQHDVESLTSPRDALARIRSGEVFDAILCDVMMPEMSGVEFYQELAIHAPSQAAKVVFVSGGVFSEEARSFLDSGKHRVIEKPVKSQIVFKALAAVLLSTKGA